MSRTDSARQWTERIAQQKLFGLSTDASLRRCRLGVSLPVPACRLPAHGQESQRKGASSPVRTFTHAPAGRLAPCRFHALSSKALTPACRSLKQRGLQPIDTIL